MDEFHHAADGEETNPVETPGCKEEPRILDEIRIEELAIDGICGVY